MTVAKRAKQGQGEGVLVVVLQRPSQARLGAVVVALFHLGHGEAAKRQWIFLVQLEDVQKLLLRLAVLGLDEGCLARLEIGRAALRQGGDLGLKRVGGLIPRFWLGEQFLLLVGVGDFFGLEYLEARSQGVEPILQLSHQGLLGPILFPPVEDAGKSLPLAGGVGVFSLGLGKAFLNRVDVVAHFLFAGPFLQGLELILERVVAAFCGSQVARGLL